MEYKICNFETLESTNDKAKEIAKDVEEGTVIIAQEQSKGKGRLGRNWHSSKGKNILMSIVLKPNIEIKDMQKIVLIGAAAVYMALKDIGIDSQIKWPNDILIGGKKVCGILTESSISFREVSHIILGIGINANEDIEDIGRDLIHKATSLKLIKGGEIDREKLLEKLLYRFKELYIDFRDKGDIERSIQICRKNSAILGKEVLVVQGKDSRKGIALDLSEEGHLLVQFTEAVEQVYSGEVSIRGLGGYID